MKNPTEQPIQPEIEEGSKPLQFSWVTRRNEERRNQGINLTPDPEQAYAYVAYASPLPEGLSETEKERLTKHTTSTGDEYWYCGFGEFDLGRALKMSPNELPSLTHHMERNQGNEKITPSEISLGGIADVIENGNTVIYTGAGISVAAGTPDMKSLMVYLGIDRSKSVDGLLKL